MAIGYFYKMNSNQTRSYNNNSDYLYQVFVTPFYTSFKKFFRPTNLRSSKGKRGIIKGFSSASRRRLIKYLLSLEESPKVMITLTYPAKWKKNPREWKKHLHNFRREFERYFPEGWVVWKLEFQKRGAPHFHLLADFRRDISFFCLKTWVSYVWYRIVGSGDEDHLKAGTNIEFLDSKKKVRIYVSKYVNKEDCLKDNNGDPMPVGRWWGKFGKLPRQWKLYCELDYSEFVMVRRIAKRWVKALGRKLGKTYKKFLSYLSWGNSFTVWWDQVTAVKVLKFLLPGHKLKLQILSYPGLFLEL